MPLTTPPGPVALFVTCLVDQILPEIGVATVHLLRKAGYQVDFPMSQTCCGQPFFNSGFQPEAITLAKKTVKLLEPYQAIIIPSGSCTTMIRAEYAHLLKAEPSWHKRVQQVAAKTFELSEFLVHQTEWNPSTQPNAPTVTYHDSCHMCRTLQLKQEPRTLLKKIGCTIKEMPESDRCCGFGGIFSIHMPEISNAMTTEKLQQAEKTEAPRLITADSGCLIQMQGLANQFNLKLEHIATFLERLS